MILLTYVELCILWRSEKNRLVDIWYFTWDFGHGCPPPPSFWNNVQNWSFYVLPLNVQANIQWLWSWYTWNCCQCSQGQPVGVFRRPRKTNGICLDFTSYQTSFILLDTWHCTVLHCTEMYYCFTALHCTSMRALNCKHCTALHCTALNSTVQNINTLDIALSSLPPALPCYHVKPQTILSGREWTLHYTVPV